MAELAIAKNIAHRWCQSNYFDVAVSNCHYAMYRMSNCRMTATLKPFGANYKDVMPLYDAMLADLAPLCR
jgi:hypothetical protein